MYRALQTTAAAIASGAEAHAVVPLERRRDALERQDGLVGRQLRDLDRGQPPREPGVREDDALVVLDRRRADARELAAPERHLQLRGRFVVRREDGVQLVEEEDDAPLGVRDLGLDLRHPLGERAADPRARQQTRGVDLDDDPVVERRDVAPSAMRCASPRTTLVLPTPAGPTRHGQLPWRLASTSSVRSISASRPRTGSSSPRAAAAVRLRPIDASVGKRFGSSSKRPAAARPAVGAASTRVA